MLILRSTIKLLDSFWKHVNLSLCYSSILVLFLVLIKHVECKREYEKQDKWNMRITMTTTTLSQSRGSLESTSSTELIFFVGGALSLTPTGKTSDRVDIYNVTSGSWTTANLSIPRVRLAATSLQNLVFFGGGADAFNVSFQNLKFEGNVTNQVDIYNTLNGSWSTATLSQPRCCLAATSVGNLVLFGGGSNSTSYFNVVDVFDVTNNTWTTATLSEARIHLAATSVDNRYALFGGGYLGSDRLSNVVDIFDSLIGMWNTTTLSQARYFLAATSLGNLAFFGGGYATGNKPSNVVDIFNSTSQTWNNTTLSQARYFLAASSIGEIVAFGGGSPDGNTMTSVVDVLNVASNTWFTVTLSQPRAVLASTSSTNKIFFGGGLSNTGLSNIVDILDFDFVSPSTNEIPTPNSSPQNDTSTNSIIGLCPSQLICSL
jgi:hypothetical protein